MAPRLGVADQEQRYRAAHEPHERGWWQILWLFAKGQSATAITESTGYTRYWIGQIAKRYNEQRPDGMRNRQHTTSWRAPRMLSVEQHEDLRQAPSGPAPDGAKRWRARDVADWIAVKLGRPRRDSARLGLLAAAQTQPAGAASSPCLGEPGTARYLQKS